MATNSGLLEAIITVSVKKMLRQMYIDPKQTPQEAQAEVLAMTLTVY